MSKKSVYVIATMDTKGEELMYVSRRLSEADVAVKVLDVGTKGPLFGSPDISRSTIWNSHFPGQRLDSLTDRGVAVEKMGEALRRFLVDENAEGRIAGVLGLGGSGGTSIITKAMRALPIGLPKLMVSTVASGNVAPYVDCSDILMLYSVVDISGINAVSEVILSNAAAAMAGMVNKAVQPKTDRQALGMTMFGVTTPCVDRVRHHLEKDGYDCLVFHATGAGGRAMEQLVSSGMLSGVLDITTTEVADEVVGGVFPSGPNRFDALIASKIPLVISLGAVDMVNFGALETVPHQFRDRKFHAHNAQVTLMRTTPDENRAIARWIASKLNQSKAPIRVLVPERGVSLLDVPGQPFYDPEADQALFDELQARLEVTTERQLIRLPFAINDPEFADALVEHFLEITNCCSKN